MLRSELASEPASAKQRAWSSGLALLGGPWSSIFALLTLASVLPLLLVSRPPLQDMPQHLAAISVLRHYPDLSLGTYFELHFLRTQYLAYYGLAYLLSFVFGVELANKLLLCAALIALPWSLAQLLRALGRDPRLAVFSFGLTYNAHLVLGFFNFIAALPLLFMGLTAALRFRRAATRGNGILLGALLLGCFYMHVVPFAFLALGTLLVLLGGELKASVMRLWVFVPVGIACGSWLFLTPAGSSTLAAAGGAEGQRGAQFATVAQAMRDLPMWLTDVLTSERDDQLWVLWVVALLIAFALGVRERTQEPASELDHEAFVWRLALLCPLAALAYFVAPTGYDWIWPISARFPLLSLLFALLLVPNQRGVRGQLVLALAAAVALFGFVEVGQAFREFEREEVGDFERALEVIPKAERVAGLIFDRGSRSVKFSPFLQYVALYQAQKGGAVMFTFADFPQSPFHFREALRPPRVPPRWEWQPERVDPERDLAWYHYVLVRGGPGRIARQPELWQPVFSGRRWRVYKHR
ncbi:MAG: hypothetical protein QM778_21205 [Myxococcales bacterium]